MKKTDYGYRHASKNTEKVSNAPQWPEHAEALSIFNSSN